MPDVQNVFRRGGAYWWRRTLTWWGGEPRTITLSLSLGTKDLGIARRRAAAMTAQSEVVRMSLYERVARDGLTAEQRDAVFGTEMRAHRDGLEHLCAEWLYRPEWAKVTDVDSDLQLYEAIWSAFANKGVVVGMHLILDARSKAVREMRLGIDTGSGVTGPASTRERPPTPVVAQPAPMSPAHLDPSAIPERWRDATPVQAAELLIASTPAMLEHRKEGKRAATQVGEQTLRPIRWAAVLLQKSMNPAGPTTGIRPFWTCGCGMPRHAFRHPFQLIRFVLE